MSKIRELVEALAECDEFLGNDRHPAVVQSFPLPMASPPAPALVEQAHGLIENQLRDILAMAQQARAPLARPRGASEAVLDAALQGAKHYTANGIPVVNPNDRMVTDPTTGSVTRIPNGANQ